MTVADPTLARALSGVAGVRVLVEGDGPLAALPAAIALPVSDRATVAVASGMAWAGERVVVELSGVSRARAVAEALAEAAASSAAGWPGAVVVLADLDAPLGAAMGIDGVTVWLPADEGALVGCVSQALEGGVHLVAVPYGLAPGDAGAVGRARVRVVGQADPGLGVTVAAAGDAVGAAMEVAAARPWVEVVEIAAVWPPSAAEAVVAASVRRTGRLLVAVEGAWGDALRAWALGEAFWSLEAPPARCEATGVGALAAAVDAVAQA
jgi:pyruvate/2-oxoglutarate/acetoin dehydrogenase E1 component